VAAIHTRPRLEDAVNGAQDRLERCGFLFQEPVDVDARRGPGAPQRDDVLDFRKREPETATLLDERQHAEHVVGVHAIARLGTTGRRQNPARFVHAEGLAADAAALDDLTDSHGPTVDPALWGQVKRGSF